MRLKRCVCGSKPSISYCEQSIDPSALEKDPCVSIFCPKCGRFIERRVSLYSISFCVKVAKRSWKEYVCLEKKRLKLNKRDNALLRKLCK